MTERACDVAIIGGGPAGLSAALMLGRACRTVCLIDDGHERNLSAREAHGFLGQDGFSPVDLLVRARSQLDRYSAIQRISDHVDAIDGSSGNFRVELRSGGNIFARRIIFAAGVHDELPEIVGLDALWGKRIFVCPYCDGWEFRDRRLAVIGNTCSALEFAQELWNWSRDIVICSIRPAAVSDELRAWQAAAGIELHETHADGIRESDGRVVIDCGGGTSIECDAIFICAPLKQHSKLPEVLGCEVTDRGTIRVDAEGRTTVEGCYAAGDCVTKYHQIVFAAASGARAAIAINEEFFMQDARELIHGARPLTEVIPE